MDKNIKSFENFLNEGKKNISPEAANAAMNTEDAYSFDLYKYGEWEKIAQFLIDKGYTQEDVEDILKSKIMRHLATGKYGTITAATFAKNFTADEEKYADSMIKTELKREPKNGKALPASDDFGRFNHDLIELMAKYKGKVSDADMAKSLKTVLSHTITTK